MQKWHSYRSNYIISPPFSPSLFDLDDFGVFTDSSSVLQKYRINVCSATWYVPKMWAINYNAGWDGERGNQSFFSYVPNNEIHKLISSKYFSLSPFYSNNKETNLSYILLCVQLLKISDNIFLIERSSYWWCVKVFLFYFYMEFYIT